MVDVEQAAGCVDAGRISSVLAVPSVYLVGGGDEDLLPPGPTSYPYACVLKPPDDGQLRLNIDSVLASQARERRSREERARAISTLERKLAELQDRHAFAHTALDNMTEGVVLTGRDGKFRLINRAALAAFDSNPDEDPHGWLERLEVLESDEATPVAESDFPIRRTLDGRPATARHLFVRESPDGQGHPPVHLHPPPFATPRAAWRAASSCSATSPRRSERRPDWKRRTPGSETRSIS